MWKSIVCVVLLCACVDSPRSESNLAHRDEPLHVSGLFEVSGVDLDIQIYSHEKSKWVRFATTRTRAEDPVIDQSGRPYFHYATNVVLPQAREYWFPHKSVSRIEARVRVAFGERVLATFGGDAESCGRRAQAAGKTQAAALEACASRDSFSRVFVAACGGLGEPCCPGATAAAGSCDDAFACDAGLCSEPSYPVPVLRGYQVDLAVPSGYALQNAFLVIDDTTAEQDSQRALVIDSRALSGVRLESPHPNVSRLIFDFAFWKPGVNRFFVRGDVVKGDAHRRIESATAQLDYHLPRSLGSVPDEPGSFRLPHVHFPRTMSDCAGALCKDRDGDGLNDLWENVATQQLRPRLLLDGRDDLFRRKSDVVRVMTSVAPLTQAGQRYVLFASVVAFSRDYGHFIGDHPGDTEAFGILYRVDPKDPDTLRWVSSVAKGHACMTCGPKYRWHAQDFAIDGTPLIYVEEDKHGLWQSGRECRTRSAFGCRGDRSLRPDASNVGDYTPEGARALVDSLDGLLPDGPFGGLAGVFPGDAVWTAARARVPGRFCGGARRCNKDYSANMPGAVIASLVKMFEARSWN